jgi:hypothetical protein
MEYSMNLSDIERKRGHQHQQATTMNDCSGGIISLTQVHCDHTLKDQTQLLESPLAESSGKYSSNQSETTSSSSSQKTSTSTQKQEEEEVFI